MKIDESIEWVKDRMTYGRYTPSIRNPLIIDECYEAGMMAIEALEKQIPKKPFHDDHTVIEYCPNCKRQLRTFISVESQSFHGYERKTLHANYCENCGQAIDWGEL